MAGCHEVVWLVGSSSLGKAFVEAFGPWPGRTGMPNGAAEGVGTAAGATAPGMANPFVPVGDCGQVVVPAGAGVAYGATAGAEVAAAAGAAGAGTAFGSSGMGFIDGVGARTGGCVGCGWIAACGCDGTAYPP
jgi:hypothetical protein